MRVFLVLLLGILSGCSWHPCTQEYHQQYAYLKLDLPKNSYMQESDYFLIILVDARHLDYSNNVSLLKTLVKHPADGSKNGDVGHAWVFLKGIDQGREVVIEAGQSGELGLSQAKYFDGIMNYIDFGYANPTQYQMEHPRYEPNPIRYLWEEQQDGYFEPGSGEHTPTFAAKIDLTYDQFCRIRELIRPGHYCYENYSITKNQCCTLVRKAAAIAGLDLETKVTIDVQQTIKIGNEQLQLWTDSCYSKLTFDSPDVLESSLMQAVYSGEAENALYWYNCRHRPTLSQRFSKTCRNVRQFPSRLERFYRVM